MFALKGQKVMHKNDAHKLMQEYNSLRLRHYLGELNDKEVERLLFLMEMLERLLVEHV